MSHANQEFFQRSNAGVVSVYTSLALGDFFPERHPPGYIVRQADRG